MPFNEPLLPRPLIPRAPDPRDVTLDNEAPAGYRMPLDAWIHSLMKAAPPGSTIVTRGTGYPQRLLILLDHSIRVRNTDGTFDFTMNAAVLEDDVDDEEWVGFLYDNHAEARIEFEAEPEPIDDHINGMDPDDEDLQDKSSL